MIFRLFNQIIHFPIIYCLCFEIEMDIKRSFPYFKLNVIVEIRLLAKFDYCTILKRRVPLNLMSLLYWIMSMVWHLEFPEFIDGVMYTVFSVTVLKLVFFGR